MALTEPRATIAATPVAARRGGRARVPVGWLMVLPAVVYLLVWTVYPLLFALYTSLTDRVLTKPQTGAFVGLANFRRILFDDATFHTAVVNTLWLTVLSIAIELALGYWVAKLFFRVRDLRGTGVLRTLFIIPIMLTPLIVGLSWSYILNPTLGVASHVLAFLRLPNVQWLANPDLALYTVIGINAWQWLPFMMLLILAGLNSIPRDLEEVSTLEGANWPQRLRNLELPFITEVAVLGILIRVMENLKLFDIVYATTSGGPGKATEVLSLMAYRQSFLYYNTAYGAAIAILILILSNILVIFLFRTLLRGIAQEARG
jgi:multiple sugar transport system permease protein